jgi:putative redox protein
MTSSPGGETMEPIPIKATLQLGQNRRIVATARSHEIVMDIRKDRGGDDAGPTPPEFLAMGLGGCVMNICRIMAAERQFELQDLRVSVTGDIDPSRAFGLATDNRAGFSHLFLEVAFNASLSTGEKDEFRQEFERRCPLCDTIGNPTPLKINFA